MRNKIKIEPPKSRIKPKLKYDPMNPSPTFQTERPVKETIKKNILKYLEYLEESHFEGRMITSEAKLKIKDAIDFGFEVSETLRGYLK